MCAGRRRCASARCVGWAGIAVLRRRWFASIGSCKPTSDARVGPSAGDAARALGGAVGSRGPRDARWRSSDLPTPDGDLLSEAAASCRRHRRQACVTGPVRRLGAPSLPPTRFGRSRRAAREPTSRNCGVLRPASRSARSDGCRRLVLREFLGLGAWRRPRGTRPRPRGPTCVAGVTKREIRRARRLLPRVGDASASGPPRARRIVLRSRLDRPDVPGGPARWSTSFTSAVSAVSRFRSPR